MTSKVTEHLIRHANKTDNIKKQSGRSHEGSDHSVQVLRDETSKINEQIDKLTSALGEVRAGQNEPVKFADLGFRSFHEVTAWLEQ